MVKKGRGKGTVRFMLVGDSDVRKAFVAGDFTGWRPLAMQRRSGMYSLTVSLPPGRHQYKFILGGQWVTDPDNIDWAVSDMGTINSLVVVDSTI